MRLEIEQQIKDYFDDSYQGRQFGFKCLAITKRHAKTSLMVATAIR